MKKTEENGITLIALVVTIIVLLILAGITISLVIGQNGIITRAKEATEKQEIATEKERLEMAKMAVKASKLSKGDMTAMTAAELNAEMVAEGIKATASGANPIIVTFTESQREYEVTDEGEPGVNWDEVLNNTTTPHPDQTESNDIGIGTDGKVVNLDLWRYTLSNDNASYGLQEMYGCSWYNGYIGEIVNGKIIGKVPQYIKAENGTFLPVTNMHNTFFNTTTLITAPEIPSTVTNMRYAFEGCSSLITAPVIPEGVTNMESTFENCSSLIAAPVIPKGVIEMNSTFYGCTTLVTAPVIPDSVTNMWYTFRGCTSLTTAPVIPNSVKQMWYTFYKCSNLTGELVINANPTKYDGCLEEASISAGANLKLTGTSTMLNEILGTKSADSNISLK